MARLSKYLALGVFFLGGLFLISNSDAADTDGVGNAPSQLSGSGSSTSQEQPAGTKQNGYGAVLDHMSEEKQKGYLDALRRINTDLRNEYAALAKNYTAYRANYERTKYNTENRRTSPNYVLKNMQNLEAAKGSMEANVKKWEKDKEALKVEVLSFYGGKLPQWLTQEWNREEKEYTEYLNAVYRQVGWWMQIEYSPQWRKDESQLWDYIRQYYQQHPKELDILK
ncbi:MAG: hypothetical protein M0Z67_18425 [Nitrospiraceae bacterium]|nr:hypothetical protein [Nitrospiraceae bacterium]